MEGRSAVWLLAALLLEALISAEARNSLEYLEVDKKLNLRPEPGLFSGSIRSMSWKLNGSLVAVLDEGQELAYNPVFGGRAKVDTTTGVLEIRNTIKTDSGVYTVAINNKIQDGGYDVRVIQQVPKPELTVTPLTCSKESKSCSLSCNGDITDAEPVTFYFKVIGDWDESEQNIIINNDASTQVVETLSCRMKNPLGQKDSEPVKNPFYINDPTGAVVGGVFGGAACIALIAAGVFCLKKWTNSRKTSTASTKENGNQGDPLTHRSSDSKEDP